MTDVAEAKARLRSDAIARRDALPESLRLAAAEAVAWHGLALCDVAPAAIISGFSAIGPEIDPALLMASLARNGHPLALPVIVPKGRPLIFRRWAPGEALRSGLWGIREPFEEAAEVDPDVLLVPLLAFDGMGRRLGYGAGYFDRTLARLRGFKPIIAIGLAYDEQEVAEVPVTPTDEPLDWVLTPSGARRLDRESPDRPV